MEIKELNELQMKIKSAEKLIEKIKKIEELLNELEAIEDVNYDDRRYCEDNQDYVYLDGYLPYKVDLDNFTVHRKEFDYEELVQLNYDLTVSLKDILDATGMSSREFYDKYVKKQIIDLMNDALENALVELEKL